MMTVMFRKLWQKITTPRRCTALSRQIEDILQRVDAIPTLDNRSGDEILGYDECGLPR
jgi:hypothetical protein